MSVERAIPEYRLIKEDGTEQDQRRLSRNTACTVASSGRVRLYRRNSAAIWLCALRKS